MSTLWRTLTQGNKSEELGDHLKAAFGENNVIFTIETPSPQSIQQRGNGDITIKDKRLHAIENIKNSGSGDIRIATFGDNGSESSRLLARSIVLEGSGNIHVPEITDAKEVMVEIVESGQIKLGGNADSLSVTLIGSGGLQAKDLTVDLAAYELNGSGNIDISAKIATRTTQGSGSFTNHTHKKNLPEPQPEPTS